MSRDRTAEAAADDDHGAMFAGVAFGKMEEGGGASRADGARGTGQTAEANELPAPL